MTAAPSVAAGSGGRAAGEDWIDLALALLARRGIGAVTVLDLSGRLGVSRSSFYWHFRSREGFLEALIARWGAMNTASIVRQAEAPAATITEAVCNIFRCWVDAALFSPKLDMAVRDWARCSDLARNRLDAADRERTAAIEAMFVRHGFAPEDALVRARVLYTMQIGYYALDIREPIEARLMLAPRYLETFTGVVPREEELAALRTYALARSHAPDFEEPT